MNDKIDETHNVPYGLMYATDKRKFGNPRELIAFWREVFKYQKQYPELQADIAYWSTCKTAGLPLTNDNDIYEAVHAEIGFLESDEEVSDRTKRGWSRAEEFVNTAERELNEKEGMKG